MLIVTMPADQRGANAGNSNGGFHLNGGSGSFAYNFTDRFSVLADLGAYRFRGLAAGLNSTMYTYLLGPRISLRRSGHVAPFGHLLLGGGRLNVSSAGVEAGENGFAIAAGGGVDAGFRHHMAIRVIQAEYLLTRFPSVNGASATQSDIRLSAGIVFRFGGR